MKTILACLLVLVVSGFGISGLEITSDNRSFFGPTDQKYTQLIEFEQQFSPYSTIAFLITSTEPISDSTDHQSAHSLISMTATSLPFVQRIDSLTTVPRVQSFEDLVDVKPLLEPSCHVESCSVSDSDLSKRTLRGRLVSEDKRTSSIVAYAVLDPGESSQVATLMKAVESQIRGPFLDLYPTLQLHITGGVPMMQEFANAAERDLSTLIPIAALILVLMLYFVLGGAYLATAMTLLGIATCLITLGVAGWFGLVLNSATSSIPIVIFSLILASTMHLFLHLTRGEEVHGAKTLDAAVSSALAVNTAPIVMTIMTTVIGMLSLISVPSPPVKDLGLWVAFGLVVGMILTFTALPAGLSLRRTVPSSTFVSSSQRWFNSYARNVERKKTPVKSALLVSLICIAGISFIEVDDDFVSYFNENSTFRIDTDFASEELTGPYGVELVLTLENGQPVFRQWVFAYLKSLSEKLRGDARVKHVLSLYDILDSVREDFQDSSVSLEQSADEKIAQLFLAYDLSLQKDQSTTDFIDITQSATRVSVLLTPMTSKEIRGFAEEVTQWHEANGQAGLDLQITGESIPTAYLSPTNIHAMVFGILFSLAFSASIIGLYYRSSKIAIVALVSILVPVMIGFGIWGWIYGSIGLAATVVVAITIGVVIDDSIHMIVRAHDGKMHLDLGGIYAAAYSVHRVGVAIVGTTLVLCAAFCVLMLSQFELNSAFGFCTILILLSAMLFDFLFLPRLIGWSLETEVAS